MKTNFKLTGILLLSFLFSFAGCNKETDKPLKDLLLGKWEKQSAFYEYFENAVKTGEQGDTFEANEWVYEFIKDGEGNIYESGTLKSSFSWTLIESALSIENPGELTEGEASISKGILTIEGDDSFVSNGITYENHRIITFKKI